ncbi:hypothetical protein N9181_01535, partial [bacterium]|nr:hypothetical protein [bacterium]
HCDWRKQKVFVYAGEGTATVETQSMLVENQAFSHGQLYRTSTPVLNAFETDTVTQEKSSCTWG